MIVGSKEVDVWADGLYGRSFSPRADPHPENSVCRVCGHYLSVAHFEADGLLAVGAGRLDFDVLEETFDQSV